VGSLMPRRSTAELIGAARDAITAGHGAPDRPRSTAAATRSAADPLDTALRAWRAGRAKAANVPAHVVLPDRAVAAIASGRPRTLDDLREVPGIGPSRAAAYGEQLLALVRANAPSRSMSSRRGRRASPAGADGAGA
jgi:superfamily II DNA helicase RecQ